MKPEPVVVLATPHSQAAHVGTLIGNHPRALALPELKLFSAATVGELLALYTHGDARGNDGLLRAIAWLFCGDQQDADIVGAQHFLEHRRDWSTAALMDWITDRIAPQTAVFHDISAPLHIVELDRWLDAAPDAAYLHLIRHPAIFSDIAKQTIHERLYIPPDYSDHRDYPRLDPQLMWFRVHDTLTREFGARPQCRYRRVRLETLQATLAPTLEQLCHWLGWSAAEDRIQAMCRTADSPFAKPGPPAAPAGAEADFLRDPQFATPLRPWTDDDLLARASLASEVITCARAYGYR